MKQRQDNNIATIQARKEQWVYYFLPFHRFFHNFISLSWNWSSAREGRRSAPNLLRTILIIDALLLASQNQHFQTVKLHN